MPKTSKFRSGPSMTPTHLAVLPPTTADETGKGQLIVLLLLVAIDCAHALSRISVGVPALQNLLLLGLFLLVPVLHNSEADSASWTNRENMKSVDSKSSNPLPDIMKDTAQISEAATAYLQCVLLRSAALTHPLHLPAALVIGTVVHKFAGVAVAAEARLFVVLADVRLVIEPHGHARVHIGAQRPVNARPLLGADGVLPPEPLHDACTVNI